jgi:hypothetical protein
MAKRQRTNNHLEVEVEDTKGFIRIRISKKNKQHDDQKRISKQWSIKHTYKTKDRVTRTPLKTGVNSGAPEAWAISAPRVNLIANPVLSHVLCNRSSYSVIFVTYIY